MGNSKLTHYEVSATRRSPQRTAVTTEDGEFVVGHDVNPVEYLLGSLLACINSTATMVARDMEIDIESLEATIEGDVNYGTYLGKEYEDRLGRDGGRRRPRRLAVGRRGTVSGLRQRDKRDARRPHARVTRQ